MNCLYKIVEDSFDWPKVEAVRALSALFLLRALFVMVVICAEKDICVSSVRPRIVGFFSRGRIWFSI